MSIYVGARLLEISDSASAIGQVLAARTIPMVLFLLWGGVIADRISRALIIRVSNLLGALTQGTVAYLVLSGQAELWMIIVLEAINGTTAAVSLPAMDGLVPQLVPRVMRANHRRAACPIGERLTHIDGELVGPAGELAPARDIPLANRESGPRTASAGTYPRPGARITQRTVRMIAKFTTACAICPEKIVPGDPMVNSVTLVAHSGFTPPATPTPKSVPPCCKTHQPQRPGVGGAPTRDGEGERADPSRT